MNYKRMNHKHLEKYALRPASESSAKKPEESKMSALVVDILDAVSSACIGLLVAFAVILLLMYLHQQNLLPVITMT
jgi:sterol desaturase/sphingolipid hydroxylase (fatty acid hydroxylase superfamily)